MTQEERELGMYEDTGDTYPVCDVCGDIAPSRSYVDAPCMECGYQDEDC